jgi:hypothetical protein
MGHLFCVNQEGLKIVCLTLAVQAFVAIPQLQHAGYCPMFRRNSLFDPRNQ